MRAIRHRARAPALQRPDEGDHVLRGEAAGGVLKERDLAADRGAHLLVAPDDPRERWRGPKKRLARLGQRCVGASPRRQFLA